MHKSAYKFAQNCKIKIWKSRDQNKKCFEKSGLKLGYFIGKNSPTKAEDVAAAQLNKRIFVSPFKAAPFLTTPRLRRETPGSLIPG